MSRWPVGTGGNIRRIGRGGHLRRRDGKRPQVARKNGRPSAVNVTTEPFPGFPTDLQAQMMAMSCRRRKSVLEKKYSNQFFVCMRRELVEWIAYRVHGSASRDRSIK
jgi:UDP-N-acetylglucosamine 1-carboxyvinyltransferase